MIHIEFQSLYIFYFHVWNFLYKSFLETNEDRRRRLHRERIQHERRKYQEFLCRMKKAQTEEQSKCEKSGIIMIRIFDNYIIEKSIEFIDFENLEYVTNLLNSYLYGKDILTRPDLRKYITPEIANDAICAYYLQIIYG